ncbi:uncharacterized protein LOC131294600 [Anopheles ziemanni]|uniref:uncharacterized protein LOC131294600 n=1 Tax=Anopheles ziemanni TaxID=345580 RepID=UPI002657EA12|nr:uncharacterized protein LOC131263107 isoform X1 [Anopheles coustani]XP_058178629.1 uncharacterized protein LOC131294600 [Anopheles ziemanni]
MDGNSEMDPKDVVALEERLYSQFHHSYEVTSTTDGPSSSSVDNGPSRVVTKTSVVNNAQSANLQPKRKRYWGNTDGSDGGHMPSQAKPFHTIQTSLVPSEPTQKDSNNSGGVPSEPKKMYLTPYQSLLGNTLHNYKENSIILPAETNAAQVTDELTYLKKNPATNKPKPSKKVQRAMPPKRNNQLSQQPVQKKFAGLMKLADKSKDRRERFDVKKTKATATRQRNAPRVVAQIFLDSSDEDSKSRGVVSYDKIKQSESMAQSDEETDDVVIVPLPEPPKICIESSDDEVAQDSFAFPHAKKTKRKVAAPKLNSPRCVSPSNSSIMSDDFIGLPERSRLSDNLAESIPNDDELDCSIDGKRAGDSRKGKQNALLSRDQRAPSISSDGTVCTSSDTTDQEKRLQESNKGNLSPVRRDSSTVAKKADLSSKKVSSQAKGSKHPDKTPMEKLKDPSTISSPKESVKKGSSKKASSTLPAKEADGSNARPNCKSPISVALELARKHFDTDNSSDTTVHGTKKKSKKDRPSDVNQSASVNQESIASKGGSKKSPTTRTNTTSSDVDSMYQLVSAGSKAKRNTDRLELSYDSVSSESDYELTINTGPNDSLQTKEKTASNAPLEKDSSLKHASAKILPELEKMGAVSSESDYEESFVHAIKSTPKLPPKEGRKRKPKRKQYNSENYSDEDFASMLTDIVRAISDTDAEEEENEEQERQQQLGKENFPKEASDSVVTSSTVATSETASEPQKKSTKTDGPLAKKKKRSNDISLEHVADVSHSSNLNDADQTADEPIDNAVSTANTAKVVEHGYQSPKKLTNVDPGSSKKKKRLSEAVTTSNTDVSQRGPDDVNQSAEQSMVSVVEQTNTTQDRSQVAKNLPDCAWNEEMKLFYNDVWVDEDFNLASVMQKMPRGRKHWEIMQQDLYPSPPRKQPICLKCGEQGHMRFKCRNPPKPPVCYMCGEQGHQEPRCPRTICLNCGERTRNFVRGCNACARDLNMVCKLCGVRGHGQRVCPDLWRRYHSTTEDNVPLRGQYHINMKTKYCCICCKQGHQAHACTAAYRIFGQALPTIHIKSYLPAYRGYQPHNERSQSEPEAGPRYNLFSDQANECELNLHDLAENPNGFYYRFVKSSGLIEKQQLRMNQEREAQFKVISHLQEQNHQQHQCHQQEQQQQPQHDQEQRIEDSRPIFHESLNEFKTQQQNAPEQFQNEKIPIDVQSAMQTEDSNYSFSVLAEEAELVEKNNAPQEPVETNLQLDHPDVSSVESGLQTESVAASSMPDFIPLSSEPSPPAHPATPADATESSDVTDGKVYLTKQHAKALLSDRGSIFVKEAAEKHSLKLSITFESVGNVLLICGTPNAQDLFHTELVHFLGQGDADTVNKALIAQNAIPRKVRKALYYVTEKLLQLTNAYGDVKALFSAYESAKPNDKKAQKLRCQLNMVLFGQFGLREGKKHLGTLRHHVLQMMNSKDTLLDPNHRNVIWEACMYIFSTYDHTEYKELVNEYEELRRTSQLHKFSWSDLQFQEFPGGLSLLCRLSKDPALYEMYANPGNGSNSRLLYDEQVPSAREDILLNTYDQTIDTDRLNSLDNATRDFQDDQTSPAIPDVPVDENQFCRHGRHGYATRQKRSQSEGRSQTSPAIPDVPVDENQFWRHGRQFYATLQKRSQTVKPGKALQTIQQIHRLMRKVDPPNKKFMSNHLKHLESMMPMYNGLLPNREMHQLFKMRAALKKHQTEVKRRAKAMRLAKSYTY